MPQGTFKKVDCKKYPGDPTCKVPADIRNKFSSSNPMGEELMVLLDQYEAALNTNEGPSAELVLALANELRQEHLFNEALLLIDMLPRALPQLTTSKDTLLLSQGMQLRARILDQMPNCDFQAENAFAFANQLAIMTGRLDRG